MPYPNESSCRLIDPDKVNIVGSGEREHDGKKYRVIYGKPKDGDGSVEQAYRYPVNEWSESEARAHCRAHDGILFEPATGREAGVEFRFWASVHSIETGAERLATFYLMNTSINRNGWRVTDKAIEDALPGLMGKALNCIPGYRVNHVHEPLQVGRWVKVEKPDGYALAMAEISDPVAWEKLNGGEWGPVSVVIRSFRVTCSKCGADITGSPDEHIQKGEGHEVIESFRFERVDFVADPAYPQAGLLTLGHVAEAGGAPHGVLLTASAVSFEETVKAPEERDWDMDAAEARVRSWAGGPDKEKVDWTKYRRAFAWYDSGDPEDFGSYKLQHHDVIDRRFSVVWKGVAAAMQVTLGARGGVDVPEDERRGIYNHLSQHYRQFEKEPPEYHASRSNLDGPQGAQGADPNPEGNERKKRMEAELEQIRTELDAVKAENEQLREKLQRIEAERHQENLDRVVEARVKAGLARDREAEADRIRDLDDGVLVLLAEDAEGVVERLAKAPPTGPKAKYTPNDKNAFEAAVEDARERLFGHRREAEA